MDITITHKPLNREEIAALATPVRRLFGIPWLVVFSVGTILVALLADYLVYQRLWSSILILLATLLAGWTPVFLRFGTMHMEAILKILAQTPLFPVEHQIHFGDDGFSFELPDYRLSCDYTGVPRTYLTHVPSTGDELLMLRLDCLPIFRKSDFADPADFAAVLEKLRSAPGEAKPLPPETASKMPLVFSFHRPARDFLPIYFWDMIWTLRYQNGVFLVVMAIFSGIYLHLCFDVPYALGCLAGGLYYVLVLLGSIALVFKREWNLIKRYLPEDYRYEIDPVRGILREITPYTVEETAFRNVRGCTCLGEWLVVRCSLLERHFLPRRAFPSEAAFAELLSALRAAVKRNRDIRLEVIPATAEKLPGELKKDRRKGCLIGCGVLVLLAAGYLGYLGFSTYRMYRNMMPILSEANAPETLQAMRNELQELSAAFQRLNQALEKNAPALSAKRRPPTCRAQARLHEELPDNGQLAPTLWFMTLSGLEGSELIPGHEVTGIEDALENRKANDMAVVRLVAPYRAQSLLLLHDGSGDGYFCRLTRPNDIYYDMLEDGEDEPSLGTMAQFINAIAEAMEKKLWTYDADGKLIEGQDAWMRFQEILRKNTATSEEK